MLNKFASALATLNKKKADKEAGFSLIERIVVVAILGILVAVAIPVYGNIQDKAADNAAKTACGSAISEAAANDAQGVGTAAADAETHHSKGDITIRNITNTAGVWTADYDGARGQSGTC